MGWTTVKKIFADHEQLLQRKLEVRGWIRTQRESKNFAFIELNDGSCFKNLQVVYGDELANFGEVAKYPLGSSLKVTGTLVPSPAAGQPFELKAETIEAIGLSALDYPLQKKRHSFEFLRTIPHLRPRTNTFMAVFRVRSLVAYALHKFFHERDFVYVHTPIITASDAEGAGQMFRVTTLDAKAPPLNEGNEVDFSQDFFGRATNLTVSGQLNVEGFCLRLQPRLYLRPHLPRREFQHPAPRLRVLDDRAGDRLRRPRRQHGPGRGHAEIRHPLRPGERCPRRWSFSTASSTPRCCSACSNVLDAKFEHVTYTRAIELLQKADTAFNFPPKWGCDLQTEHERYLSEKVFQKPVFVTDYPKEIKAFYMRLNDDGRTVAAMDLLVPDVGEIIGGSQREERYDALKERIAAMGLKSEDYEWYLSLRRFGGAPHAGFGLGFERAVMYLTGMENIRDVIPYPRTPKSAEF